MNRWSGFFLIKKCRKPEFHLPTDLNRRRRHEYNQSAPAIEWKGFHVTASAVGDNVTFYECSLDFIATSGQAVHMEQVVVSKWRDGKIVHERFYYDTGSKR